MHCSDLERYLEACLDGQLGDSRRAALLQHLALCRHCSERVGALRRFEADLQRRLRAMRHEASLWQPLGLEVVGGDRPLDAPDTPARFTPPPKVVPAPPLPRRATGRPASHRLRREAAAGGSAGRRAQRLVGATILLAAMAALVDLALGLFAHETTARAYRAYLAGEVELDQLTAEPDRLAAWLGRELGEPVALPATPPAVTLVGASAGGELPAGSGLVVYATEAGPAVLSIEAAKAPLAATLGEPELVVEGGISSLRWRTAEHAYSLVSALPPDKLSLFAVP